MNKVTLTKSSVIDFASMYGERCGLTQFSYSLYVPETLVHSDRIKVELVQYANNGKEEAFLAVIDGYKTVLQVSGSRTELTASDWKTIPTIELTGYVYRKES